MSLPDRIAEVIKNRGCPTKKGDSRIFFYLDFVLEGSINICHFAVHLIV